MAEWSKDIAALAQIFIFFYVLYVYLLSGRADLPVVVYSPITKTKRLPIPRGIFSSQLCILDFHQLANINNKLL